MTNQWVDMTLDDILPAWAERTRASMEQGLRDTAPIGKGPTGGRFANSIEGSVTAGGLEIDFDGDAIPGTFLMTGTEAHIIRGFPLRWEDAGGDVHFAFEVHHPGTQPSDFVDRAIDAHEVEWWEDLGDATTVQWGAGG